MVPPAGFEPARPVCPSEGRATRFQSGRVYQFRHGGMMEVPGIEPGSLACRAQTEFQLTPPIWQPVCYAPVALFHSDCLQYLSIHTIHMYWGLAA